MQKRRVKIPRRKRSPVWLKMTDTEFSELVARSRHIGDVLNAFGLENIGRNHHTARARIESLNLSTKHFDPSNRNYGSVRALDQILVKNSTYTNNRMLKKRLIASGLLYNKCYLCPQEPFWNGKPLMLVLDHVNGIRRDHTLSNLRLLCPNCNSQTETFCGKNNIKITS